MTEMKVSIEFGQRVYQCTWPAEHFTPEAAAEQIAHEARRMAREARND